MKEPERPSLSLEIIVGGVTVFLSTLAFLLGSTALGVVALVIGSISFGILLGTRESRAD